jgi:hypothetical protein
MSVPCCQKDIQRQFSKQQQQPKHHHQQQGVQGVLEPLLSHGILRQRQLDLLTDTFRAALLRLAGYRWVWVGVDGHACVLVLPAGCCLSRVATC